MVYYFSTPEKAMTTILINGDAKMLIVLERNQNIL